MGANRTKKTQQTPFSQPAWFACCDRPCLGSLCWVQCFAGRCAMLRAVQHRGGGIILRSAQRSAGRGALRAVYALLLKRFESLRARGERRRLSCASFFLFGCSIAYIPLFHCHFSNSKEGVPRPISHLGCWCLLDPYRHVHLKDDTRAKTFVQSTGEVKFSSTSYTIHVRARSLNLSFLGNQRHQRCPQARGRHESEDICAVYR